MNTKNIKPIIAGEVLILLALILLTLILPFGISYADECDSTFKQAHELTESAHSAFSQEDYRLAEQLYNQAASYYKIVAEMSGCTCPKIAGAARENSSIAINNAEICKSNLANKEKYEQGKKEHDEKIQEQKNKEIQKQQIQDEQQKRYEKIFGSSSAISAETLKEWSLSPNRKSNSNLTKENN